MTSEGPHIAAPRPLVLRREGRLWVDDATVARAGGSAFLSNVVAYESKRGALDAAVESAFAAADGSEAAINAYRTLGDVAAACYRQWLEVCKRLQCAHPTYEQWELRFEWPSFLAVDSERIWNYRTLPFEALMLGTLAGMARFGEGVLLRKSEPASDEQQKKARGVFIQAAAQLHSVRVTVLDGMWQSRNIYIRGPPEMHAGVLEGAALLMEVYAALCLPPHAEDTDDVMADVDVARAHGIRGLFIAQKCTLAYKCFQTHNDLFSIDDETAIPPPLLMRMRTTHIHQEARALFVFAQLARARLEYVNATNIMRRALELAQTLPEGVTRKSMLDTLEVHVADLQKLHILGSSVAATKQPCDIAAFLPASEVAALFARCDYEVDAALELLM